MSDQTYFSKAAKLANAVSSFNVLERDGVVITVGTPSVTVKEVDSIGNVTYCGGASVPTNGDAGYAVGCFFKNSAGGAGTTLYVNEGSATSATFNAVSTTSAGVTLPFAGTDSTSTTGTSFGVTSSTLTTGSVFKGTVTTGTFTTGGAVFNAAMAAVTAGNGFVATTTGVYTGTGLMLLTANSATTGTLASVSATGLTTGFAMLVTGGSSMANGGALLKLDLAGATAGAALKITGSGTYSDFSNGMFNIAGNSVTNGSLMILSANALTSGNAIVISGPGAARSAGGATILVNEGATTQGIGLEITTSGVYTHATDALIYLSANSATTAGNILRVDVTGLTTGTAIKVKGTAATLTTGFYFAANDASLNVFTVGANGHLTSNQTTAPTVASTVAQGITAAAVTAGSSDTCGQITTTGTQNNTADSTITITFNKTYTTAPKSVILTPANNAASNPLVPYVSSITATTFVVGFPKTASGQATPAFYYQVIA